MASMTITYRRLNAADDQLLDEVTRMCMNTVLETIPEFAGDLKQAQAALPNFSFASMRAMLESGCANEAHRITAAVQEEGHACGYSAYSLKRDGEGDTYGYLFSRGVAPASRRRGIATHLLLQAEAWFRQQGAVYLQAETHVTNMALRTLLERHGFITSGPSQGVWPYFVLRKHL